MSIKLLKGGFILIDYMSLLRLGLDKYNIDCTKSYEIISPSTYNDIINIYFNKEAPYKCHHCNSNTCSIIGSKTVNIKYSFKSSNSINLILHRRKFKCLSCNSVFLELNPFSSSNSNISYMTELNIMDELKNPTNTFKDISIKYRVSDTYVSTLFDRKFEAKRNKLSTVLSIDEIHSKKLSKSSYCCVLFDPIYNVIIDILNSRRKDYLKYYFSHIPLNERLKVKYVSIDMWESYKDISELYLPNAFICVDSFHVIKHLSDCFKNIRIRIMKKYSYLKKENDQLYWYFKSFWKFLMKDINTSDYIYIRRFKTYVSKGQIIDYMLSVSDELRLAYELKEDYRSFNRNVGYDPKILYDELNNLIYRFRESNIEEYKEFYKLLNHWKVEIVNSFIKYNGIRISNSRVERFNGKLRNLIDISFGLSNFIRFRNRAFYCFNKNTHMLAFKKKGNNQRHIKK